MKPVKFKEANKNLLKPSSMTDDECGSLWVFNDDTQCISCWKVPFWNRIKLLFHGNVWLSIFGGNTQPPCWVYVNKTIFKKN